MDPRFRGDDEGRRPATSENSIALAMKALALALLAAGTACGVASHEVALAPDAVRALDCVAVLPFDNDSGIDRAGEVMAHAVANELMVSSRFNVLEPSEAARIMNSLGLARRRGVIGPEEVTVYGAALGVQAVMIGSVSRHESRERTPRDARPAVSFAARLIDVGSGDTLWATTVSSVDDPVLLALPRSRFRLARAAIAKGMKSLIEARSVVETRVCWKPPPATHERFVASEAEQDAEEYAVYPSHGGETLSDIATRFLLNPKRIDLIAAANPNYTAGEPLRRNTPIKIPRFMEYAVRSGDTLARVGRETLGHAGFSTLIFAANRPLFRPETEERATRPGLLVDATQRWSLFDVVGSVDDMFVVVNGVPAVFPAARVLLRWLVYGRKLPMSKGQPREATFFEVTLEHAKHVTSWRIDIRHQAGKVVRAFSGEGAPPERVPWDGLLAGKKRLAEGQVYHYQLILTFTDGTQTGTDVESFGTNVTAERPTSDAHAIVKNEPLLVRGGRFVGRFSTETYSGVLPVELRGASGAWAVGNFLVPSVTILRPRRIEMLEAGVSNDIYRFPAVSIIEGRLDPRELDAITISFELTGRTESKNRIILDGKKIEVNDDGSFTAQLSLHRGRNLYSILASSPDGSQTFLEEQIVLRTRGPENQLWEFAGSERSAESFRASAPLTPGMRMRIPLLKAVTGPKASILDALYADPTTDDENQ